MSVTGPMRGMGPVHYQREKVNKCEEFHRDNCTPNGTDKCCAVVRCTYCLRWSVYGADEDIISTVSTEDAVSWIGSIEGVVIELRLARDYGDKCVLEVYQDSELLETIPLCEEQYNGETLTCRDLSYSLQTTIGYDVGELSWYPFEKRKLQYRRAEDGCWTWFCGECECTCKSFCVSVFDPAGSSDPYSPVQYSYGRIDDSSYDECLEPVWLGDIGEHSVGIQLYPNDYTGECMVSVSVGGESTEPQQITFCDEIDLTFTFPSGKIVTVRCATCEGCEEPLTSCCSCEDSYSGCLEYTTTDPCVDRTTVLWDITPQATSPNDWGSRSCEYWSNPETYALSMMGCEYANHATSFRILMVEDPSDFATSVGVDACDWVCEVYSDGVYQGYFVEYARECLGTGADSRSVLDWIQFFDIPIPNTAARVTLTMVRTQSTTSLCVPDGRPGV